MNPHKIDSNQQAFATDGTGGSIEFFYTKMRKDRRIYIPKAVFFAAHGKDERLTGYLTDVTLEPT